MEKFGLLLEKEVNGIDDPEINRNTCILVIIIIVVIYCKNNFT